MLAVLGFVMLIVGGGLSLFALIKLSEDMR